ncbi:hypothetical protein FOZ62_006574, partial [Perkinsus olseni]
MPSSFMFIHRPSTEVDTDWPWQWGEIRMPCLLLLTDDESSKVGYRVSTIASSRVWERLIESTIPAVWNPVRCLFIIHRLAKRPSYGTAAAGVPTWMLDKGNLYRSNFVT